MMSLDSAIHILARVHTREDDRTEFFVIMGATPGDWDTSHADYVEAWRTLFCYTHGQRDTILAETKLPPSNAEALVISATPN